MVAIGFTTIPFRIFLIGSGSKKETPGHPGDSLPLCGPVLIIRRSLRLRLASLGGYGTRRPAAQLLLFAETGVPVPTFAARPFGSVADLKTQLALSSAPSWASMHPIVALEDFLVLFQLTLNS